MVVIARNMTDCYHSGTKLLEPYDPNPTDTVRTSQSAVNCNMPSCHWYGSSSLCYTCKYFVCSMMYLLPWVWIPLYVQYIMSQCYKGERKPWGACSLVLALKKATLLNVVLHFRFIYLIQLAPFKGEHYWYLGHIVYVPNDAVLHKGFRLTGRLLLLYCRDRDGLCGRWLCKRWRFYQPWHHVLKTSVCLSTQQLFVFVSNCWVYIVIVPNCLLSYPRGGKEGETQQSHVLNLHQRGDASSAGHSVPVVMVTVDFRLFVPSWKQKTKLTN